MRSIYPLFTMEPWKVQRVEPNSSMCLDSLDVGVKSPSKALGAAANRDQWQLGTVAQPTWGTPLAGTHGFFMDQNTQQNRFSVPGMLPQPVSRPSSRSTSEPAKSPSQCPAAATRTQGPKPRKSLPVSPETKLLLLRLQQQQQHADLATTAARKALDGGASNLECQFALSQLSSALQLLPAAPQLASCATLATSLPLGKGSGCFPSTASGAAPNREQNTAVAGTGAVRFKRNAGGVASKGPGNPVQQAAALEMQLAAQQAELATALGQRQLAQLFEKWRGAALQQGQEKQRGAMLFSRLR